MHHSALLLTSLAVLLCFTAGILAQPLNSNSKVCNSLRIDNRNYRQHYNVSQLSLELHAYVAGCEYVHGDLTIKELGADPETETTLRGDIRKLQTDFLDSIVEISGRLIITQVSLESLTLKNLRVIRGYRPAADPAHALEIRQSLYPMELRLPKLSAITQGNVFLSGTLSAETYCYLTRQVNWRSLFQNSANQKFLDHNLYMMTPKNMKNSSQNSVPVSVRNFTAIDKQCSLLPKCDPLCPKEKTTGRSLCWSSGPYGCQQSDNTCGVRMCGDHSICFMNNKTEECCHPLCLGGCSSSKPDSCFSCRKVSNNGKCDSQCPDSFDYNPGTGQQERHNNGLLRLGFNCVKKCNLPFLTSSDGRYCLPQCWTSELPHDGRCVRMSSLKCNECDIKVALLTDTDADELRNKSCCIWRLRESIHKVSSLDINAAESYKWIKSFETLRTLEMLQVFYGKLMIKNAHFLSPDLRFLRNIKFVSDFLFIYSSHTLYLGLANLGYAKWLEFMDISGLCSAWYPKNRLLQLNKTFDVYETNVKFNDSRIECRNASCDPLCRDECWGPGPEMCVECKNFKVRGRCYKSCHEADCYESKNQCLPCHPECAGGCYGPAATDCVRCRNLKKFDTCVAPC